MNVLNRANVGRADGTVNRATGEAFGITARPLRRRIAAGLVFVFDF